MSEKRSRPEPASGATNRIKNPGTVSAPDSIGTMAALAVLSPADVSSLDMVERAWVGGLRDAAIDLAAVADRLSAEGGAP